MFEKYTGAVLMVLLVCVGVTTTLRADFSQALFSEFEDGVTQQALESDFDDSLPHRNAALNGWNAVRYGLFNETAKGAVAGKNSWLFTAEEYEYDAAAGQRFAQRMAIIADTAEILRAQDIHLVVALLPDKARIYPDFLRKPRPALAMDRYANARAQLLAQGIDAPDLYAALMAARATAPVFLERDTHWTPFGAQVIAEALADAVQRNSPNRSVFEIDPALPTDHTGDLLNFVETGPFAVPLGLLPETVAQFDIYPSGDSLGLFDDPPPVDVALIGTSYSANPVWQFADFLKLESETDLLNLSQVGQGPFVPMAQFLKADIGTENSFAVVVWEIPERFLTLSEF